MRLAFQILLTAMFLSGTAFAKESSYVEIQVSGPKAADANSDELILFTLHTRKPVMSAIIAMRRDGTEVFRKEIPGHFATNFQRHNNGTFSYAYDSGRATPCGGYNASIVSLDQNFEEIDRFHAKMLNHTDLHDFKYFENGTKVFTSFHRVRSSIAPRYKAKGGPCWSESVVQEVDKYGDIVFEWHSSGEIPFFKSFYDRERRDSTHVNSVELMPSGDEYMLSLRGQSSVLIVSRDTAEITEWIGELGGSYSFTNDPMNGFCGQHTAIPVSEDSFILYDNRNPKYCHPGTKENPKETGPSRALLYSINRKAKTIDLEWSYTHPDKIYGEHTGGISTTPKGDYMITWGDVIETAEKPKPVASEITKAGDILWEFDAWFNLTDKDGKAMRVPASAYRTYVYAN